MSNTKNKTHKKKKRKKEMAFENTKASFVAGIVVIITILNDAIGLLISIPRTVEWMENIDLAISLTNENKTTGT